jgi:hypothetical protein
MNTWTNVVMSHLYPWPIGVLIVASSVSFLFGFVGLWSLWRVKRMLRTLPEVNERLETLTNSMSLLTDTTESCFKALSMQFQFVQTQGRPAPAVPRARAVAHDAQVADAVSRKARQRRVVGAARRGDAIAEIAAREDVSESEVALRLHVNRDGASAVDTKRYGQVLS